MRRFCMQFKIFNSVVQFITVNMVNRFAGFQHPVKMLRHYKPMLFYIFSINKNPPVTIKIICNPTVPFPMRFSTFRAFSHMLNVGWSKFNAFQNFTQISPRAFFRAIDRVGMGRKNFDNLLTPFTSCVNHISIIILLATILSTPKVFAGTQVNPFTGQLQPCTSFEESDGSPSINCIDKLLVANGNLTDNGDGTATLADQTGVGGGDPILIGGSAIGDASGVDLIGGTDGIDIALDTGVSPDTATFNFDPAEAEAGLEAVLDLEALQGA